MKLATLKSDNRDGELIVVNRALTQAAKTWAGATMQSVIE
ncbi:MAG: hypothetical protein ACI85U_003480, partial [Candidatus Promineifilaceae bacterium]